MKLPILDLNKRKTGEKVLPAQFSVDYRPDLIKRAVLALQCAARQAYGTSPEAGLRHSTKLSKRRRKYRGCYGLGISRVNRKIMSRSGTRFNWVGAFSPQTVGGRRSHPPKAGKILQKDINKKENRKAICSAISATLNKTLVEQRGHQLPEGYPFLIDGKLEEVARTREVQEVLQSLGFQKELERSLQKKIRAGMGTRRGRKYQRRKGILLVVSKNCPLVKSAANVPGVDVVEAKALNAELLAPGALPGRVTLWTEKAVEIIDKEKMFI